MPGEIDEKAERRDHSGKGEGERRARAASPGVGRKGQDRQQRHGFEAGGLLDRRRRADREAGQNRPAQRRKRRQRREKGENRQRSERAIGVVADGDLGQDGIEDRREEPHRGMAEPAREKEERGCGDRVARDRNRAQRLERRPERDLREGDQSEQSRRLEIENAGIGQQAAQPEMREADIARVVEAIQAKQRQADEPGPR